MVTLFGQLTSYHFVSILEVAVRVRFILKPFPCLNFVVFESLAALLWYWYILVCKVHPFTLFEQLKLVCFDCRIDLWFIASHVTCLYAWVYCVVRNSLLDSGHEAPPPPNHSMVSSLHHSCLQYHQPIYLWTCMCQNSGHKLGHQQALLPFMLNQTLGWAYLISLKQGPTHLCHSKNDLSNVTPHFNCRVWQIFRVTQLFTKSSNYNNVGLLQKMENFIIQFIAHASDLRPNAGHLFSPKWILKRLTLFQP